MNKAQFSASVIPSSARPLIFDEEKCIGCNRCAAVCQVDILIPNPVKGKPPVVLYPGECYYCGSCVMECPSKGAIRLAHPLMNQAKFVPVKEAVLTIRQETPEDFETVEHITREAFFNVHGPGCCEHYLLHHMRSHGDFVPELSMVALVNDTLAGSIVYTKAHINGDDGQVYEVLCFGPISVLPEYQGRGIGRGLMAETKKMAAAMGYRAIVIYGDPEYYAGSGFVPAQTYGIATEDNMYKDSLLAMELYDGALAGCSGRFLESEAFSVDMAGFDAYDRDFPQKDKKTGLPSQERFNQLAGSGRPRA